MSNKKGTTTWGELLSIIIVLILIGVSIYFITKTVQGGQNISDCENRGGICKQVCHFPNEQPLSLSCDDKELLCCWDPNRQGPGPTGEAIPNSDANVRENHRIYVYDADGKTVSTARTQLEAGKQYTYFFKAEGKDVGVCYASVMQRVGGQLRVLVQGEEKRIRMSPEECKAGDGSNNRLDFHLTDPSYAHDEFYIQFYVFDIRDGKTVADIMAHGGNHEIWTNPNKRIASYQKPFTTTAFNCDQLDKDQCTASTNCIYCPTGTRNCLSATANNQIAKNTACSQCLINNVPAVADLQQNTCVAAQAEVQSCSDFNNNPTICTRSQNCAYCLRNAMCLQATSSQQVDLDKACADGCPAQSEMQIGYFDTQGNVCGFKPRAVSGCQAYDFGGCYGQDSCVWCETTPICLDVSGTRTLTCSQSCLDSTYSEVDGWCRTNGIQPFPMI